MNSSYDYEFMKRFRNIRASDCFWFHSVVPNEFAASVELPSGPVFVTSEYSQLCVGSSKQQCELLSVPFLLNSSNARVFMGRSVYSGVFDPRDSLQIEFEPSSNVSFLTSLQTFGRKCVQVRLRSGASGRFNFFVRREFGANLETPWFCGEFAFLPLAALSLGDEQLQTVCSEWIRQPGDLYYLIEAKCAALNRTLAQRNIFYAAVNAYLAASALYLAIDLKQIAVFLPAIVLGGGNVGIAIVHQKDVDSVLVTVVPFVVWVVIVLYAYLS